MKYVNGIIIIMLTGTFCAAVLGTLWYLSYGKTGSTPDDSKKMIYDLLIYIIGVISGYISRSKSEEEK
jgi:hypothetical protein